jgi:hypothetical protein
MPVAGKDKESILGLGCASISRAPAWKVKDPEFILSPSTTVPPKKKERKKVSSLMPPEVMQTSLYL